MSVIDFAERGWLPDALIRYGIKRLLLRRQLQKLLRRRQLQKHLKKRIQQRKLKLNQLINLLKIPMMDLIGQSLKKEFKLLVKNRLMNLIN